MLKIGLSDFAGTYTPAFNINKSTFQYNELDELISDKGIKYNTKSINET